MTSGWYIITSEYPPQPGGVSDYTQQVAAELASYGDEVHIWCPPTVGVTPGRTGVTVHRELGRIAPADLKRLGRQLDQFTAPRRLLVQWVPHGYGYRSMNLPFCWWLLQRARDNGDSVELMVHEPYLGFNFWSLRQNGVAAVHRLMTMILLQAARRVWMSIPAWESRLQPYTLGRKIPFTWLPIPSNIAVIDDPAGVSEVRARYTSPGQLLLGHFGTYGQSINHLLLAVLLEVMRRQTNLVLLLLGRGGELLRCKMAHDYPELASRINAPGALAAADISLHLSACDLMFQPYPDGITSRRTSAMAGLAHGKPLVTTMGHLTEEFWATSGAVVMLPVGSTCEIISAIEKLIVDRNERVGVGVSAKRFYEKNFGAERIVAELHNAYSQD